MTHPTETYLHFCIEGEGFETLKMAYSVAVKKGFDGSYPCFRDRVLSGLDTWDALTAPVNGSNRAKELNAKKAIKRQAARDEMAALMAEMDARKKAIDARRD